MYIKSLSEPVEFLRLPAVKALTGLGTTKIYEMAKDGVFPRQVKLGGRAVAWIKAEVLEWNREQVARSRGHTATLTTSDRQPVSNQS